MKALVIWLIVLSIVSAAALLRIGVQIIYQDKALAVDLVVSKWKISLIGKQNKKNKSVKKQKKPTPANMSKPKSQTRGSEKTKGNPLQNPLIQAVLEYWREILSLIGRVLTTPTLDVLNLQVLVGGGDAETCAMTYGRICAVISGVLPVVENTFGIRKRQINVCCCYDRDSVEISAETAITVRIYEIFALVFALLGLGIKILLQARKNKKAVQTL